MKSDSGVTFYFFDSHKVVQPETIFNLLQIVSYECKCLYSVPMSFLASKQVYIIKTSIYQWKDRKSLLNYQHFLMVCLTPLSVLQVHTGEYSVPSNLYVTQSCTSITHSHFITSVFVSYPSRCSKWWPSWVIKARKQRRLLPFFFPSYYPLFHFLSSYREWAPKQCFYEGCIKSNKQLTVNP